MAPLSSRRLGGALERPVVRLGATEVNQISSSLAPRPRAIARRAASIACRARSPSGWAAAALPQRSSANPSQASRTRSSKGVEPLTSKYFLGCMAKGGIMLGLTPGRPGSPVSGSRPAESTWKGPDSQLHDRLNYLLHKDLSYCAFRL